MRGVLPIRRIQGQMLPFLIPVDAYLADVVGELRQPLGDPPVRRICRVSFFPFPAAAVRFRISSQPVERGRQTASVRPEARRRGESVRASNRSRFQLQHPPGLHFPAGCQHGGTFRGTGRRKHRARQAGRPGQRTAAAAAVLMQVYDPVFALPPGRDEGGAPLAQHHRLPPFPGTVGKRKVSAGVAPGDVNQLLPHDFEESRYQAFTGFPAGELEGVAQKRDACPGFLTHVVDRFARHEHLRLEGHPFGPAAARAVEEAADVRRAAVLVAHRGGSLHERVVGQGAEKPDRVEQVRLPRPVGPDHAGERTEAHIDVYQVLEAGYFQSRQHELCLLMAGG